MRVFWVGYKHTVEVLMRYCTIVKGLGWLTGKWM